NVEYFGRFYIVNAVFGRNDIGSLLVDSGGKAVGIAVGQADDPSKTLVVDLAAVKSIKLGSQEFDNFVKFYSFDNSLLSAVVALHKNDQRKAVDRLKSFLANGGDNLVALSLIAQTCYDLQLY